MATTTTQTATSTTETIACGTPAVLSPHRRLTDEEILNLPMDVHRLRCVRHGVPCGEQHSDRRARAG